jgi:hypothetical protein
LVLTFSFAKQDRVAPLLYVYRRDDATGVLVAQLNQTFHVPEYYLGRPRPRLVVIERRESAPRPPPRGQQTDSAGINYVILYSDAASADSAFLSAQLGHDLRLLATVQPSLADRIAHAINPRHNKARAALIYTTS